MSESSERKAVAPRPVEPTTAADPPTIILQRAPFASPLAAQTGRPPAWTLELEGQQLDHFLIDRFVGGGGMGAVFRALDLRLGRPVALKLLPPEAAADEDTVRRFEKEARSAARLDHDHIARVHYRGEDRGYRFIALEYVEGHNLRDLVAERGPLAVGESVRIALQIAGALAHVSRRGVVHRDIKPSNVILSDEGRVKLIDLGLARVQQATDDELTTTGTTLGTFDYIAPEQARDPRAADVRSDIYSLGCTWYYMLTGRPPFPEGTVLQKLLQHQGDDPPDPREFRHDLPESLCAVLRRMLAKDAAKRYPTAEALIEDLHQVGDEVGAWAERPRRQASAARIWLARVEQHLPWLAPVVMLGVLVWGLDAWTRRGEPRSSPRLAQRVPAPDAPPPKLEPDAVAATPTESMPTPAETSPPLAADREPAAASSAASSSAEPFPRLPEGLEHLIPLADIDNDELADEASRRQTIPPTAAAPGAQPPSAFEHPMVSPPESGVSSTPPMSGSSGGPSPFERSPMSGAAPEAPLSASEQIAPRVAEPVSGVLAVADSPAAGLRTYGSLQAALHAARDGDCIELRYDGFREETPLEISGLTLTIRAGEGYRPVLAFRPTKSDPYAYPRHMLRLEGGRLTLIGLGLVLDLPRGVAAESWSLVECSAAESLRFERCTLTIRNAAERPEAYHEDVAFLRVRPGASRSTMLMDEPPARAALTVQLQDTIARGEAVFVKSEDAQPIDLHWDNGLVAVSERFVEALGGRAAPAVGEALRLDLRHLTLHARRGLMRLSNATDAPHQLPAEVHCVNSIVMVDAEAPLIEQQGIDTVRDFRERLVWTGERNFYQGFAIFWKIAGLDAADEPEQATLATWQSLQKVREHLPSWGRVRWQVGPSISAPRHRDEPADYALVDDATANPAYRGGSDGRDAGAALDRLPAVPQLSIAGDAGLSTRP